MVLVPVVEDLWGTGLDASVKLPRQEMASMLPGDAAMEVVLAMLQEARSVILVRSRAFGHLGFVFFFVTDAGLLAHCWGTPGLPGCEPWEDELIANLAKATSGKLYKFIGLCLAKAFDALGLEGPTVDGGVKMSMVDLATDPLVVLGKR
jgi:hypothetical protein